MRASAFFAALSKVAALALDIVLPRHPADAAIARISHDRIVALLLRNPVRIDVHEIALAELSTPLVQALIYGLKYRSQRSHARPMGCAVAHFLSLLEIPPDAHLVLVPIPQGRAERAYNQSELIAQSAAACSAHPSTVLTALRRVDRRAPQTAQRSAGARKSNMRGAFAAHVPILATYWYVIIDDVRTTGATLAEARRALKSAGARRVLAIAVAQTPRSG